MPHDLRLLLMEHPVRGFDAKHERVRLWPEQMQIYQVRVPLDAATARPTRKLEYRRVGEVSLSLHLFEPDGHTPEDRRAAIVFFFGGGWTGGNPKQFYPHCAELAARGMVAMAAEYRSPVTSTLRITTRSASPFLRD